MKLTSSMTNGLVGLLATHGVRAWMRTLDYRAIYLDREVDPILARGGTRIYVFWHENLLIPLYLRGRCHISMLLSQHRDADILGQVAKLSGFGCVRGSTYRGGARALMELFERSRTNHLAITPDGPRGPRRKLAQGPIYLASKLGLPIVAMGMGYDSPWRAKSWDRFAIPKPFSRARGIVSGPISIPPDLDRDGVEYWRLHVERMLNELSLEAESWAESGRRREGEIPCRPQSAQKPMMATRNEAIDSADHRQLARVA
jgi:lysophospholipid acyltransferase (LPLAT)-like uncharacterized protein